MILIKFAVLVVLLLIGSVAGGKLKLVAFKRPHAAFVGVKVRTPKLLGFKHGLGGLGHKGGLGGGSFHSGGYEHHEYHHESHYSGGSFGGGFGGGLGAGGWLGK